MCYLEYVLKQLDQFFQFAVEKKISGKTPSIVVTSPGATDIKKQIFWPRDGWKGIYDFLDAFQLVFMGTFL